MTNEEFSNEFDILLNSYAHKSNFGEQDSIIDINLNEYEKSVFLTNAQEEIVLELYKGNNIFNDSFEETEELRRYLSSLSKTALITKEDKMKHLGLSETSTFYMLPEDLWFITYEAVNYKDSEVTCNNKGVSVIPITQDEYHRIKNNPFRGTSKKRVLRIDHNNMVELIANYNIDSYFIKYLSKPTPIILVELPSNISINGEINQTECKLNPVLHRAILNRAVTLALASKSMASGKK